MQPAAFFPHFFSLWLISEPTAFFALFFQSGRGCRGRHSDTTADHKGCIPAMGARTQHSRRGPCVEVPIHGGGDARDVPDAGFFFISLMFHKGFLKFYFPRAAQGGSGHRTRLKPLPPSKFEDLIFFWVWWTMIQGPLSIFPPELVVLLPRFCIGVKFVQNIVSLLVLTGKKAPVRELVKVKNLLQYHYRDMQVYLAMVVCFSSLNTHQNPCQTSI